MACVLTISYAACLDFLSKIYWLYYFCYFSFIMASEGESSKQLLDIIKCSICLELIKEPKLLPCIHTFCFQCLETLCENNDAGVDVPCPLCRKVFSVPLGGIQDLPTNFFMIQLLQLNQSEAIDMCKTTSCELCSELDVETVATAYCVECVQHFCDRCSLIHRKQKVSKSHQIVDAKDIPSTKERIKNVVSYCELHPDKPVELFCYDCKNVTCLMCYVKKHNKHECTDIKEAAEKFSEQLKDDIEVAVKYTVKNQEEIQQIQVNKASFIEAVAATHMKISQRYEQLLCFIQSDQSDLLEELNVFTQKRLKELENKKEGVERQIVIVNSRAPDLQCLAI